MVWGCGSMRNHDCWILSALSPRLSIGMRRALGAAPISASSRNRPPPRVLTAIVGRTLSSLFAPTPEEVRRAVGRLAANDRYGELARDFFANLTRRYLDYYPRHPSIKPPRPLTGSPATTGSEDLRNFAFEQAVGFKNHLAKQVSPATGEIVSKATLYATLMASRNFVAGLADRRTAKGNSASLPYLSSTLPRPATPFAPNTPR